MKLDWSKVRKVTSGIGSFLGVLLVLYISILDGCFVTVWRAPAESTTFALRGSDERGLAMIFTPSHETYLIYTDEETNYLEAVATHMRGSYGTHYFGPFWKVRGGWFSYRFYRDGITPVDMETTVTDKVVMGSGVPSLPEKGERFHLLLLFKQDSVRFEDMWLQEEPTDPELLAALKSRLSSPE